MKHKHSTSLLFTLFSFLFLNIGLFSNTFAECMVDNTTGYDQYSRGKYSYECNAKNYCLGKNYGGNHWDFNTSKQLIIKHNLGQYPDLTVTQDLSFDDIQKIYEDVQNRIMDCAVLKSKYALHKKILSYELSPRSKGVLEKANEIIEKQIEEQKCIAPRDGDKIYVNKDLLDSMAYELCGYTMYLYYYEQAVGNNIGLLGAGKEIHTIEEWREVLSTERNSIQLEYDLSQRTMDTALSMYENFERTYIAHVILEMIEVELTENKRFVGGVIGVIKELVRLFSNAQGHQKGR